MAQNAAVAADGAFHALGRDLARLILCQHLRQPQLDAAYRGVTQAAVTEGLELRAIPRVFVCGEMLDWEAPTGGYLLNACFASGLRAGRGAVAFLQA